MKLPKLNKTKSFPLQARETIVQNITSLQRLGPIFLACQHHLLPKHFPHLKWLHTSTSKSCHVKDANQHPLVSTVDFHRNPKSPKGKKAKVFPLPVLGEIFKETRDPRVTSQGPVEGEQHNFLYFLFFIFQWLKWIETTKKPRKPQRTISACFCLGGGFFEELQ